MNLQYIFEKNLFTFSNLRKVLGHLSATSNLTSFTNKERIVAIIRARIMNIPCSNT
jgi:hypothetical protein